jgi:Protein kinase domain
MDTSDPTTTRIPYHTIEQKLGDFFPGRKDNLQASYSDKEIQQISDLLRTLGRQSWSTVPRIYIILRLINELPLLDVFIDQGITDIWFPFTERTLPDVLSPSTQTQFLERQSIVFTKALDLENEEHRKHVYFGSGEPIPFEAKELLGRGAYGTVDKVVSLLSHREYARKAFKRGRNFSRAKEDIRSFLTEIQVLKRVQHRHCVELVSVDPAVERF